MNWREHFLDFPGRPTVGISSCLAGELVRYDGTHKKQNLLLKTLSPLVDLQPHCPEVAAGLGTPRPAVRLVRYRNQIAAIGVQDPTLDVTSQLVATTKAFWDGASHDGFILKSRSPSCGLGSTPVHGDHQEPELTDGIFAQRAKEFLPAVALGDEVSLNDPHNQAVFVTACYLQFAKRTNQQLPLAFVTFLKGMIESPVKGDELKFTESSIAKNGRLIEYWDIPGSAPAKVSDAD